MIQHGLYIGGSPESGNRFLHRRKTNRGRFIYPLKATGFCYSDFNQYIHKNIWLQKDFSSGFRFIAFLNQTFEIIHPSISYSGGSGDMKSNSRKKLCSIESRRVWKLFIPYAIKSFLSFKFQRREVRHFFLSPIVSGLQ